MMITKNIFKNDFIKKLKTERGTTIDEATDLDIYYALGSLVRDYIAEDWVNTNKRYIKKGEKQVYYFSMEFLMGKLLVSNLINLGIKDICEEGLKDFGIDLEKIEEVEKDQGLGNGGLGRLAACFLDSMASIGVPGHGCGIRYNYGLFEQKIIDGYQVEFPDKWLQYENVWEIRKENKAVEVKFGGDVRVVEENGRLKFIHENYESVLAVPYDTPIVGYKNKQINTLRLWSAETVKRDFNYTCFSKGNYLKAFEYKNSVEAISHVLYPNDAYEAGKTLRLKQEYFLVSAGIQSIIRTFKKRGKPIEDFDDYVAIHINDTHPALAIPELMRILMDEEGLGWDEAWRITTNTIAYTNHTIMSEALEKWNVDIFKKLLPRIYMIVHEINERFCRELWNTRYYGNFEKIAEMAIIADNQVKMAHLAIVGSHSVNGVAKLHTEILKKQELKDFYEYYPYKFNNKTNGISHRRWLIKANPELTKLITEAIGDGWIRVPTKMRGLLKYKDDPSYQEKIHTIKQNHKIKLAKMIKEKQGIDVDPNTIFDIHAKRIHEYKRQLLIVLYIMYLYNRLKEDKNLDIYPRTFIFAGKAAPAYYTAKQIIKLINTLAKKVNNDKDVNDKLKVVFLENYGVSLAEKLITCANVSEQVSTTTKEASGTGNMKFMMNGAITIATLDGANIDIRNAVGDENIVIFGLKEKEILKLYRNGTYNSMDIYNNDIRIKTILDQMQGKSLCKKEGEFSIIVDSLLKHNDEFFVLKDFDDYVKAQEKIDKLYRNQSVWQEKSIINIGCSGVFSSDRTIYEYATGIWKVNIYHSYYK
ncbi:glycogen/starch/alpha-glucan phosphorylase [Caminicella sporogenes]|uniref:glycogen/starch/alpha-glucan phosphorylase n=1 Tax=Caminicella sporogenes TaxID=166485 RepID=UPI0025406978|nr:glycogen/starch/alpha-glucan phosphorylase [Caminicella sporogenes]WIF96111.1 glycogen/starch/alpha-glucan phosphorylase [Caminicella sporogenes]